MRRKAREVQLAVGIARLVLGQAAGEQRNVVAEALERAVASGELPDDYAVLIDRALDRLRSRFNGR